MICENDIINGMKVLKGISVSIPCRPFVDKWDGRTRTKRTRKFWVCECLSCGKQRQIRGDLNHPITACLCNRQYPPTTLITNARWTIERWEKDGRPYSAIKRGNDGIRNGRKTAVRIFLYNEQHGKCAVCHQPMINSNINAHIDHCHKNGQVRGLVHPACNLLVAAAEHIGFPIPYEDLCFGLKEYLNRSPIVKTADAPSSLDPSTAL